MKKLFSILLLVATLSLALSTTEVKTEGTATTSCDCDSDKEALLLQDIKELVFLKGASTFSRRKPAIPQLECIGGSAQGTDLEPTSVRCVNVGQFVSHWRCEATLDDSVQLGSSTVSCEGYRANDDPYVLRGSCGLGYTLEYTHWGAYLWGKTMRLLNVLILTPLKWLSIAAVGIFASIVILAAIRRPTRRHRLNDKQSEQQQFARYKRQLSSKSKFNDSDDDDESDDNGAEEEEDEEPAWKSRLRPRNSPVGKAGR